MAARLRPCNSCFDAGWRPLGCSRPPARTGSVRICSFRDIWKRVIQGQLVVWLKVSSQRSPSPRDQQQLFLAPLQNSLPLFRAFREALPEGNVVGAVVPQQVVKVSKDVGTSLDLVATAASTWRGRGRRGGRIRSVVATRVELVRVDVVIVGGDGGEGRDRSSGLTATVEAMAVA